MLGQSRDAGELEAVDNLQGRVPILECTLAVISSLGVSLGVSWRVFGCY